jgi:cell division septum initiation protein DivIVA
MIQIPSLKDEKSLAVLRKKLIRPTPDQPILLEVSDFRKIFELMEWWLPVEFFAATKLERFTLQWRKECYERGCQDISEYTKTIPTKPQDPCFLKPEHAQCAEKVKALEDSLQEWNNWAARLAYPLLDEFLVKEMAKLGKTPKDILTNAVPKLLAMRKEQEKELLEDKTRMEKFCTSAVKREAESRKKNNELQSEVRTKERQLRDREEGLKIQEADFKALQWKNQKTLQKESKVSDAQLRIEQGKVADLEKRSTHPTKPFEPCS